MEGDDSAEKNVALWKMRKLIQSLEAARGNGTSMISLIIPPKDQISRINQKLTEEYSTATNIKSRVNRQSVLSAISSTQNRLKLYNKVPTNGLVIYCGTVLTEDGKEKLVNIDFEPFRPINTSLYLCDNKFHTEALQELLESDLKFGFIVIDGNGALFATLSGNSRDVLHRISVDLPKKHGRGGQSALRFARLRLEKRHNYVRKCAEIAVQCFITNDRPNVSGLIFAGPADFKTELRNSDMLDARLKEKVLKLVDVSYGGDNGFNQAIDQCGEILENVKFLQEKRLLQKYFDEISTGGKVSFGIEETMKVLEAGAVQTLIVWESLDIARVELKNPITLAIKVVYLTPEQERISSVFKGTDDHGAEIDLEVVDRQSLLEWFANNYQKYGATLEFVTDRSQEGTQFVRGFGGIGALLRFAVELNYDEE